MRGSGLEGQFTVNKQGLSAPVLMITPVQCCVSHFYVDADPYLYLKGWIRLHKLYYGSRFALKTNLKCSVVDPDPGSGAFLTPGSATLLK